MPYVNKNILQFEEKYDKLLLQSPFSGNTSIRVSQKCRYQGDTSAESADYTN